MIDSDDVRLENWKKSFAKDGIVYNTDADYVEAINNLMGFFEILIDIDQKSRNVSDDQNDKNDYYVFDKDGNKIIL
jgi:hypothetical protein